MRDDPASLSHRVGTGTASHPAMRFRPERGDWRFLTIYPRRVFGGSVDAGSNMPASRLSSVSTRLLKVRFSRSASVLSRAFSSASITMFRFVFPMLLPYTSYVMVTAW